MFGSLNLGSVNVLNSLDNALGTAQTASVFTPVDVLVAVGANMGLTYYACNSDTFRIAVPMVSEKIEEVVGDKYGWLGDGRFLLGLAGAAYSHFGTTIGSDTRRMLHDVTVASWTSLAATEVCRSSAEKQMEGGSNMAGMLGFDDTDDLLDDDLLGMEEYEEVGSMNFAYGW